MVGNTLHDQKQSIFFSKLPLELRIMIYQFTLLPNIAVHICCQKRDPFRDEGKQNNKLVCVPCLTNHDFSLPVKDVWDQPDLDWGLEHQFCFQEFKRRYKGYLNMKPLISPLSRPKRLPMIQLMLACRRMHSEVQYFTYSEIKFSIHGGDLMAVHRFLKTIHHEALNSIRTICIHWCAFLPLYLRGYDAQQKYVVIDASLEEQRWEAIWRMLSTAGLQNLHLKIFDQGFYLVEDTLLEPLRAVHAENFTVQLPWPWGFTGWNSKNWVMFRDQLPNPDYRGVSGEGCDFKITRPAGRDDMVVRYVNPRGRYVNRRPILPMLAWWQLS